MKKEEFIEKLKELLNEEGEIDYLTNFKELQGYGSLSAIMILEMVDDLFNVALNPRNFRKVNSISDLIGEIGLENFND